MIKENQIVVVKDINEYGETANLGGRKGEVIRGIALQGESPTRYMIRLDHIPSDLELRSETGLVINFLEIDLELIAQP